MEGYWVVPSVLVLASLPTLSFGSGHFPSLQTEFLCTSAVVIPSWFIVPVFVPPVLVLPVLILLLSTLFGAIFCFASGATWPASAAAFASPLLPDEPASAASTLPLARVRVAGLLNYVRMESRINI